MSTIVRLGWRFSWFVAVVLVTQEEVSGQTGSSPITVEDTVAQAVSRLRATDGVMRSAGWAALTRIFADEGRRRDASLSRLVADSLLAVASTGPHRGARTMAIALLGRLGPEERGGYLIAASELEMLFAAQDSAGPGFMIIRRLGDHPERADGAEILGRIASGLMPRFAGEAALAIDALLNTGEPGRAVLAELHSKGRVSDPAARAALNRLAERGFRRGGWRIDSASTALAALSRATRFGSSGIGVD